MEIESKKSVLIFYSFVFFRFNYEKISINQHLKHTCFKKVTYDLLFL